MSTSSKAAEPTLLPCGHTLKQHTMMEEAKASSEIEGAQTEKSVCELVDMAEPKATGYRTGMAHVPSAPKSSCCNADVKVEGMGDFHDADEVCTMYNSCTACKQPCNIVSDGGTPANGIDPVPVPPSSITVCPRCEQVECNGGCCPHYEHFDADGWLPYSDAYCTNCISEECPMKPLTPSL